MCVRERGKSKEREKERERERETYGTGLRNPEVKSIVVHKPIIANSETSAWNQRYFGHLKRERERAREKEREKERGRRKGEN